MGTKLDPPLPTPSGTKATSCLCSSHMTLRVCVCMCMCLCVYMMCVCVSLFGLIKFWATFCYLIVFHVVAIRVWLLNLERNSPLSSCLSLPQYFALSILRDAALLLFFFYLLLLLFLLPSPLSSTFDATSPLVVCRVPNNFRFNCQWSQLKVARLLRTHTHHTIWTN